MNKLNLLAIVIYSSLLVGCATVPMASDSLDTDAKRFTPEPNKGSIYVNRGGGIAGSALLLQAILDGRIVGSLAPNTFLSLSVPPGEHTIAVTVYNNIQQQKVAVDIQQQNVMVETGKNYFFEVSASMGWGHANVNIDSLTEKQGLKQVFSSERAVDTTNK